MHFNKISPLKSTVASVAAFAAVSLPDTVSAVQPEELNIHSPPASAVQFLYKSSLESGDPYESFGLSYRWKGKWYTEFATARPRGVLGISAAALLRKLDTTSQRPNDDTTPLYTIHNHSAKVITAILKERAPTAEIKNANALMLGPTAGSDCFRYFRLITGPSSLINIIVEPGGTWVCSSDRRATNPLEVDELRIAFAIEIQRLPQELLPERIAKFERDYKELSGTTIKWLPPNPSEEMIANAAELILRNP